MSKGQMLRALVNQRLSAAAEQIFALFERTVLEYEEELCRCVEENQRKQRLLDTFLSPTALPHRAATRVHVPPPSPPGPGPCPGPDLNQDVISETAPIKEEETEEEQGVKQEEEQLLSEPAPEFSAVCVKTEEPSLLQQEQTEHKEETWTEDLNSEPHFYSSATEGHTEHSPDTDSGDWSAPFSRPAAQMETEADGERYNQVQIRDGGADAQFEYRPETSAAVSDGDVSGTVQRAERKKYQCFVCHKRFESNIILQIHIRVHTGEKPYSCPICKKAFAQKNNLNAHRKIHTGEKPYSCSVCKKKFGRRCTLKRHMKIHAAEYDNAFTVSCDLNTNENSHRYL